MFILLRPAGSIQGYRHFAVGFIGILLNTDAGSIRGRVLLEGGLNWNKCGIWCVPSVMRTFLFSVLIGGAVVFQ